MKRFLIRFVLAFGILLFLGARFVDVSAGQALETEPLMKAWEATSVAPAEYIIDGWGMNSARYISLGEVEGLGRSTADRLGLKGRSRPAVSDEPGFRYFMIEGELPDGVHATVTVQSSESGSASTHIGILVVGSGNIAEIPALRRRIMAILTDGGRTGETAVAISGTLQSRMTPETARALCNRVVASSGGQRQSYESDESGVTISVNAPQMGAPVDLGGLKINLQVAIRYEPGSGRTVITMASPMLTELF